MSWIPELFATVALALGAPGAALGQEANRAQPATADEATRASRLSDEIGLARAGESADWLVVPIQRRAQVFRSKDGDELIMSNGLVSRTWRLRPNAACVALGVQACYRGPRLYDCDETKALVSRWVDWFKEYRDILESDLIHGRRADGRDIDWMLHVNPRLKHKGMLVVFNPLDEPARRTIRVNLYYAGLTETAAVRHEGGTVVTYPLERDYRVELPVHVPPRGITWYLIE